MTEINIEKSQIGDISALADIKSLKRLSITECYIDDEFNLDELVANGGFPGLELLSLSALDLDVFPDISSLEKLETLKVSGYGISELPYEKVNWENIVSLDISYSSIGAIDDKIISKLNNLRELNIKSSNISDTEFILGLPKLEKLTMDKNNAQSEDSESCISNGTTTEGDRPQFRPIA